MYQTSISISLIQMFCVSWRSWRRFFRSTVLSSTFRSYFLSEKRAGHVLIECMRALLLSDVLQMRPALRHGSVPIVVTVSSSLQRFRWLALFPAVNLDLLQGVIRFCYGAVSAGIISFQCHFYNGSLPMLSLGTSLLLFALLSKSLSFRNESLSSQMSESN